MNVASGPYATCYDIPSTDTPIRRARLPLDVAYETRVRDN